MYKEVNSTEPSLSLRLSWTSTLIMFAYKALLRCHDTQHNDIKHNALGIMTLRIITRSTMTLCIVTPCIMTHSIMTLYYGI